MSPALLATALLVLGPAAPPELEQAALAAVRARLGPGVVLDPSLSRAAAALAARAQAGQPGRAELRLALAEAGSADPAVTLVQVSAAARDLPAALGRAARPGEATHAGTGTAMHGELARAVILLATRQVELEPLPPELAPGARTSLRGRLLAPLRSPRAFVTDPSGLPRAYPAGEGASFEVPLHFDRAGRWVVELLGDGPRGPQVVALLPISVGGAPLAEPLRSLPAEPDDPAQAEAQVVTAINQLRARHGLAPLTTRAALRDSARYQSARMLEHGQVAHLLPGGADAGTRLRAARVPFSRVLENLAREQSALAAHAAIEESPGHLANLLSPDVEQVGVGVARAAEGREPVVYLTELFVKPVDDGADSRLRPEERVREVLWEERRKRKQKPLLADPRLDELATRAARAMLKADDPGLPGFDSEALGLRREVAAVDAFVGSSPSVVARSKNVGNPQLRRVGIGVAIGDSPRYGAGLLWIATIYTD